LSYFLRVTARGRVHGTRCRRSRPVTGSRSRIRYTANLKGARNCLRNGEPKIRLLPNDPSSDRCVRADERVRASRPCVTVSLVMRWVVGLLLAAATVAGVFGQEELGLVGRYDDVRQIPDNYTKETNQFVFTRLIYNGRIPGYYKNWYTDYPRADRNLIAVLK